MNPEFIIIHHSLTKDGQTVDWQAIRNYHINTNYWKDIGYHAGIELVGRQYEILQGRMEDEDGAHCLGFNDKSLGLLIVGNHDLSAPPEPALILARKRCRAWMNIYGIKVEKVLGHWETYSLRDKPIEKSCPGNLFSMPTFRRML